MSDRERARERERERDDDGDSNWLVQMNPWNPILTHANKKGIVQLE